MRTILSRLFFFFFLFIVQSNRQKKHLYIEKKEPGRILPMFFVKIKSNIKAYRKNRENFKVIRAITWLFFLSKVVVIVIEKEIDEKKNFNVI